MRRVLPADLSRAARVLMAVPEPERAAVMREMLNRAHCGDKARRRLGQGTGSLFGVAVRRTAAPRPPGATADYCAALGVALAELARWRSDPSRGCS